MTIRADRFSNNNPKKLAISPKSPFRIEIPSHSIGNTAAVLALSFRVRYDDGNDKNLILPHA
ncbi:MAG: hypothetical protein FIO04_06435 [Nitrosopumilales archaeon]|nr:hypothetical protein [Nitrosopumilales archaeon]